MEGCEMWCWRRIKKISWTDRARNEKVLHRIKEERNIIHIRQRRIDVWIGHVFHRNCLLKHIIEGTTEEGIEVTGRQGRRLKQLLDVLTEGGTSVHERDIVSGLHL